MNAVVDFHRLGRQSFGAPKKHTGEEGRRESLHSIALQAAFIEYFSGKKSGKKAMRLPFAVGFERQERSYRARLQINL
jgi:hypothetical protein